MNDAEGGCVEYTAACLWVYRPLVSRLNPHTTSQTSFACPAPPGQFTQCHPCHAPHNMPSHPVAHSISHLGVLQQCWRPQQQQHRAKQHTVMILSTHRHVEYCPTVVVGCSIVQVSIPSSTSQVFTLFSQAHHPDLNWLDSTKHRLPIFPGGYRISTNGWAEKCVFEKNSSEIACTA
jgi:hypothetical protein